AALLTAALLLAASPAELARSGFWEYLSQLTSDKDSLEHVQGSKLGRDPTNLKKSPQDGVGSTGNFLEKLAPLHSGLQPRLYHDPDSLRKLIRKELESLRAKLSPYVDDAHQKAGRHLEELRQQLQPLTEALLEQLSLRAQELRRHLVPGHQLWDGTEDLQSVPARYAQQIALHTQRAKAVFQPYADRLLAAVRRSAQELRSSVAPRSPQQLQQHLQQLAARLTRNARDLHRHIQRNLEQLRAGLSPPPQPGGSGGDSGVAEEMAREVQRRIEAFRRDTALQVQAFTRAVQRETEDVRLKLSSPSHLEEAAGSPAPLEDLRASLDALWRDLSRSLSERGGDAP
ncbi:APOA5 protein, partial [Penelope pileata]|nr:APOA5 protein [Penelope pileata]